MRRLYALPTNPYDEPLLTVKTFLNSASKHQLRRAEEVACHLWNECYGCHEHWQVVRKVSPVLSHNVYCYPLMWLEENELALLGFEDEDVARARQAANKILNRLFSFLLPLTTHNYYEYDAVKCDFSDMCAAVPQDQIRAAVDHAMPAVLPTAQALYRALERVKQGDFITASGIVREIQEQPIPEQLRRFI